MPRQRCPHHQLGRLLIPRLSHQDNVRILTQQGSQACRKSQPDLLIDLRLTHEGKMELHRILQGENTLLVRGQLGKCRIQGGGLSRSRRPCDQNHPVGTIQQAGEALLCFRLKSQSGQLHL